MRARCQLVLQSGVVRFLCVCVCVCVDIGQGRTARISGEEGLLDTSSTSCNVGPSMHDNPTRAIAARCDAHVVGWLQSTLSNTATTSQKSKESNGGRCSN